ncbi:MAG: hypothetical protein ACPG9K_06795 [Poseidonibacter sp.]
MNDDNVEAFICEGNSNYKTIPKEKMTIAYTKDNYFIIDIKTLQYRIDNLYFFTFV